MRLAAVTTFACLAMHGAAFAGNVELIVTDRDGKPAPDVVVLVESAASKSAAHAAAAPVVVGQESSRFVPYLTIVPVGSTVRFVNRDSYDHHVRSTPSGPLGNTPAVADFELRLDGVADASAGAAPDAIKLVAAAAPARKRAGVTSADVKLDKAGPIGLGCHLHSSMRGQVYVSATPWFGKTDANGAVVIEGVPDGPAEVSLWHGDQLTDQPVLKVQVSANLARATAQLNFTPRRRRG